MSRHQHVPPIWFDLPPIWFDLSEVIGFKSDLLLASNLDLEQFLAQHQGTTLNCGSEFRPIGELRNILGQDPNFEFFSGVLEKGIDYRLTQSLSEDQRRAEVATMMKRGNHQSVQDDSDEVAKVVAKDVLHRLSLPVSPILVPDIANMTVQLPALSSSCRSKRTGRGFSNKGLHRTPTLLGKQRF